MIKIFGYEVVEPMIWKLIPSSDEPINSIKDEIQDLEIRESKKAVKTSYSDEAKFIALAAVDLNGGNVYRTAVAIGIPASTLREWNDARHARAVEFAEGRKEKRGNLRDKIEATVHSRKAPCKRIDSRK